MNKRNGDRRNTSVNPVLKAKSRKCFKEETRSTVWKAAKASEVAAGDGKMENPETAQIGLELERKQEVKWRTEYRAWR